MATISAAWTENQTITFDDATPAKTVEGKGPIDLADNGYIGVSVQVTVVWGSAGDGNATVKVRSSPDSGTTKDTLLLYSQEIAYTASATKRITLNFCDVPYLEVGVLNGNSAVEDITISAIYAGLEYTSA